ncbi:MAG: glucosamine-6-phosphate deaminase [Eubacteriales bacterium]
MRLVMVSDFAAMSRRAFELVREQVREKPNAVLGLATGSSPLGLYEEMKKDCQTGGTSYRRIRTFNLDEYVGLGAEHVQSYAYYMRHRLFDGLDIDLANTNIPNGLATDLNAECHRYHKLLSRTAMKRDLQILGIGSNGHIAFNEPGTPPDSVTRVVTLTDSTIADNSRLFDNPDEVPRQALSMGLSEVLAARKIVLLVSGANKGRALCQMLYGTPGAHCPASFLQGHEDVTIIADRDATDAMTACKEA